MEMVGTQDTGTLQYDTYSNDDETECIVIERLRDSEALIQHGENLPHLVDAITATAVAKVTASSSITCCSWPPRSRRSERPEPQPRPRAGDDFATRRPSTRVSPWQHGQERRCHTSEERTLMAELLVDFITSLDGYASGEGWPGFWGLEGPEYLAWLGEQPEVTYVMGANTYRLMSGFAAGETPAGQDEFTADEEASLDGLTRASKVVFSSSLDEPLTWANSTLVRDDAVEAVEQHAAMTMEGLTQAVGQVDAILAEDPKEKE